MWNCEQPEIVAVTSALFCHADMFGETALRREDKGSIFKKRSNIGHAVKAYLKSYLN